MRDYNNLFHLPYTLAGWKLRYGFERYIRPNWDILTYELSEKVLDVYYKRAEPDELVITKEDLDALSDEKFSRLLRVLGVKS